MQIGQMAAGRFFAGPAETHGPSGHSPGVPGGTRSGFGLPVAPPFAPYGDPAPGMSGIQHTLRFNFLGRSQPGRVRTEVPAKRYSDAKSGNKESGVKALAWHGKADIRCDEVPDPKIEHPRDAIIRVTACAICGSDLHIYGGIIPSMKKGDVLGHENMGEVVEVGGLVDPLALFEQPPSVV
jgi:hypothetical protein